MKEWPVEVKYHRFFNSLVPGLIVSQSEPVVRSQAGTKSSVPEAKT